MSLSSETDGTEVYGTSNYSYEQDIPSSSLSGSHNAARTSNSGSNPGLASTDWDPSPLNEPVQPKRFKPDISIRSILSNSMFGEKILRELDSGKLPRKERLKFVQVLVAGMVEKFGDRPKADIKIGMAKAVIEEFPFLKDDEGQGFEAWYTPGKGVHSATGWLEERLRNVRRKLNQGKSKCNESVLESSKLVKIPALPACTLPEEDYEGMVEWLKHHVEQMETVKEYMKKTSIKRAAWIREDSNITVETIIKEHPRLFDTPGMIEMDFDVLFGDVQDNLFLKWTPSFAERVIQYANGQGNWKDYLHIDHDMKIDSDESKMLISLSLLPAILPPGRQNKKRASVDDAMKAFINVKPIGTNLPKYLEESTKPPHILLLGERIKPEQIFVVVNSRGLEKPSVFKALDTCFKLFYVMDTVYPWQCAITWEFIQKVVYQLDGKVSHKTSPSVIAMRTGLRKT